MVGDVYIEDNTNNDDDIIQRHPDNPQYAPLKKTENKRWPNGVVPYSFVKEGSTIFSKLFITLNMKMTNDGNSLSL